jgi:hypothetical protein
VEYNIGKIQVNRYKDNNVPSGGYAHPDNGKRCWKVTGTKCDAGRLELATQQDKIIFCRKCEFYKTYADRF